MNKKNEKKREKLKVYFLLGIILIFASFFRLWQLENIPPGLYPDEAINGNEALTKQRSVFYPENNGREGLFINLLKLSFTIFGPSIWALRLVSAIIGVLTVLGLYLLTKELFQASGLKVEISRYIALLASFFLAISFWHINLSRLGFRAILLPFILTFSFYFLFKGFKYFENRSFTIASASFSFAGIFFGLGFYTYTPFRLAVLILPFIFLPYWFVLRRQNNRKKFILFALNFLFYAFIIALPLSLYFLSRPQDFISRTSGISIFATENPLKAFSESLIQHLAMFNFRGDPNWRHNFAGEAMLLWPIGLLFLIGFFISIKKFIVFYKQKKYSSLLIYSSLLSWFFIMLLPGILTYEGIPHALRAVGTLPVIYIFAGLGGWWIYSFFSKNLNNEKVLIFVLIFSLGYVTFLQFDKYFQKWAQLSEVRNAFSQDYVKMGKYLNSLPAKIEKYVIVNQPGVPVPYPDGIPMPAQTIMFIEASEQKAGSIQYLLPKNLKEIKIEKEAIILPMREDPNLFLKLEKEFPEGKLEKKEGFWIYHVKAK